MDQKASKKHAKKKKDNARRLISQSKRVVVSGKTQSSSSPSGKQRKKTPKSARPLTALPTIAESDLETVHSEPDHSNAASSGGSLSPVVPPALYRSNTRAAPPPPQAWRARAQLHETRTALQEHDVEEGILQQHHSDNTDSSSDGDATVADTRDLAKMNTNGRDTTHDCFGVPFTRRFLVVLMVALIMVAVGAIGTSLSHE